MSENIKIVTASSVHISLTPAQEPFTQQLTKNQSLIDAQWDARKDLHMFNGSLIHCIDYKLDQNQIYIQASPAQFKHYYTQKQLGKDLGIRPLSVSGIVFKESATGPEILIGKRSTDVLSFPEHIELVPSGTLDQESITQAQVDYKAKLTQELFEETNIAPERVKKISPLCLLVDVKNQIIDIGLAIEIDDFPKELHSPSGEYQELIRLPLNVLKKKFNNQQKIVPASKLLLQTWEDSYDQL